MNKLIATLTLAITSTFILACHGPSIPESFLALDEAEHLAVEPLELENIDNWNVAPVSLPTEVEQVEFSSRLSENLDLSSLSFIFGDEDLRHVDEHPEYEVMESELTRIQIDRKSGRIHMRARASLSQQGPEIELNREYLKQEALFLGESLGIAPGEVGNVIQRTFQRDSEDDFGRKRTDLLGHVTFIERSIGGVPVIGSKMVIMHDRLGNVAKVMGWWPDIDVENSRLRPELAQEETSARVNETLRFHASRLTRQDTGESMRASVIGVPVLVPEEQEDGTVWLNLQLEMDIRTSEGEEEFKPLEVRVDI